jgi:adenylate cyclase
VAKPGEPIWTDVYVFSTSKKTGINSAITVQKDGRFVGVVSIGMELERISLYLRSIQVAKTGTVFIINSKNQLIASQDPSDLTHNSGDRDNLQLKILGESRNPYLQIAHKTLSDRKILPNSIKSDKEFIYTAPHTGEKYFVSFASINNLGWIVGTVIPESDFLEEIHQNTRRLSFAVLVLIIGSATLGMFLAGKVIVEPLLKITNQTKHVETFNLEQIKPVRSIIREIDQLSIAMDQMGVGLTSFNRYLPTELVRTLIREGIEAKLGGEEKIVTICFLDLVSSRASLKTWERK